MKFADVLGRFAQVTEDTDGGYLALCPAHADSRPSLRIWRGEDDKVRLNCRVGCLTERVKEAVGLSWADLFDVTGPGNTVPAEPRVMVGADHIAGLAGFVARTAYNLSFGESDGAAEARAYLSRFGLDEHSAHELDLGFCGVTNPSAAGFMYASRAFTSFPRLTVPFKDFAGNPRGLQGRDLSGECPGRWVGLTNPEGARWAPYGVFRGLGGYGVTIVSEGPGDGLTSVAVGYDAVCIRGAALASNPELLRELADGLRGQLVVTAGDSDPAGAQFNRSLADGLGALGISVRALEIPGGASDITAWRESDPEGFAVAFHAAVKGARPIQPERDEARARAAHEVAARTGTVIVSSDQGHEAARILASLIERYGESDAMNAHALVAWSDGSIKFAPGLGFYVWSGQVWERSEVKVRQAIHSMGAALVLAGEGQKARGFTMTSRIDDLMTELRSVPSVHVDASEFDARPDLLSFRNGTVDLRTGKMREHDKADMLTYRLTIDYVPDALCPRWESFLAEIFPENPELPAYIQRMVGYGITGHVSEQCFCVLWGKGANGKSVLTDTLTAVFRVISKTTPFATFEEKQSGGIPNDIAALRGARLVMASEGESGRPMSEAILKRVTGKDMIAARFLRQEFFEFKPSFLLMLATNHKPRFRGQDEGLWRRVKMVPFKRWFAPHERDHTLDMKLLAEAEGIAAWAVRGAVEWFAHGLDDPAVIKDAVKEYRETSDALAGFFPGILEEREGAVTEGGDAFNLYMDWCEAENLPAKERWTRTGFYRAMEERGIVKKKTAKGIALVGVANALEPAAKGPGIFGKD